MTDQGFTGLGAIDHGRPGELPGAVRAGVRRRRVVRRARALGGGAGLLALCGVVGLALWRPASIGERPDTPRAMAGGSVIGIDDPMFEALDGSGGLGGPVDDTAPRPVLWRAGLHREGDLSLEI